MLRLAPRVVNSLSTPITKAKIFKPITINSQTQKRQIATKQLSHKKTTLTLTSRATSSVKFFSTATEETKEAETVKPAEELTPTEDIEKEVKKKSKAKEEDVIPAGSERVTGTSVKHEFQAETRKLLDIVARSLYTEREVFVRELVSNASDALEKVRLFDISGKDIIEKDTQLEINIYADKNKNQLIIQDSGIGMTKDEMIQNLGQIGHSGSMDFIKNMKEVPAKDIIGQFGVGFYSLFMVSKNVQVYSKSALPGSSAYCWTSDGSGTYDIFEADGVSRGTKIIIHLDEGAKEFARKENIEKIIQKYSNFVGFPIKVNNKQINTVKAIWTLNKSQVNEQEHKEFYQFIAHAYDEPHYTLHYATDSPLSIRGIFYVGKSHSEKFGMGRMEPGVSLFTRKVLIQQRAKVLPDWLRFVKGVVDSEDLPLNLSREHLQDSALVKRISNVITKRILKWLSDEAKADPKKYQEFWNEFGVFIKEGICTDLTISKDDVAKLLRFESSSVPEGELTSFEEYLGRMNEEKQKEIYFLCCPNRQVAETSPYYEAFKAGSKEVLFLYSAIDDFVMTNLGDFKGKKLVSIESAQARDTIKNEVKEKQGPALTSEQVKDLSEWLKEILAGKVASVKDTDRLFDSPAIIEDHESASFRRMMKYVDPTNAPQLPKQVLAINPSHPIIHSLYNAKTAKPNLAKLVAEQVFEDALVSAGLLDDPRAMVPRLNKLLATALEAPNDLPTAEQSSTTTPTSSPTTEQPKSEDTKPEPKKSSKKKKDDANLD